MSAATQLSGRTSDALKDLAAILALISVKTPAAEKSLIGDAFAQLLKDDMQLWATAYENAEGTKKAEIAKRADDLVEKLHQFVTGTGDCCCVDGDGDDPPTCRNSGGHWVCAQRNPKDYQ